VIDARYEIGDTLLALRKELDELVVRGVRTASPRDLAALEGMHDELERVGARFLAGRIETLLARTRADAPDAAHALLQLLSTLQVFERVLTLDTVALLLADDAAPYGIAGGEE
jgi:hypothetical protein